MAAAPELRQTQVAICAAPETHGQRLALSENVTRALARGRSDDNSMHYFSIRTKNRRMRARKQQSGTYRAT
jgi:hypothetical protein